VIERRLERLRRREEDDVVESVYRGENQPPTTSPEKSFVEPSPPKGTDD